MRQEIKILKVNPSIGDKLEAWCNEPPSDVGKNEVLFDEEVQFKDGYRMVIQAIASSEPNSEPIWTQGFMLTPEGFESGSTYIGDSFWGEYQVVDYICRVEPDLSNPESQPVQ